MEIKDGEAIKSSSHQTFLGHDQIPWVGISVEYSVLGMLESSQKIASMVENLFREAFAALQALLKLIELVYSPESPGYETAQHCCSCESWIAPTWLPTKL